MLSALLMRGIPASAGAADPATLRRLTLAEVVETARQQNPQLLGTRERARAAAAIPAQARALDDPVGSWETWNVPAGRFVDRADNNIFRVSQRFPFPGKRGLAGAIATHGAEGEARAADAVELDIVAAATRAYWDLWLARERRRVSTREKELVERFAHVAEQRYGLGQVSQSDVLRAQVELTHFINRLATETLAIDGKAAELNAVLSRSPGDSVGVLQDPPMPRLDGTSDQLIDLALQQRPELAQQRAAIAREQSAVELAHKGYLPDFEVSVGHFINAHQPNGFGAMFSMTIPIAYKAKYDAGVEEASARLSSVVADGRRLEDMVRREVHQAFLRVRTARLQHELFATTHIPQAEQALRVTEAAYQSGAVEFLALVDTVRAIESVHLEHIEAAAEVGKALADLERALGGPLPMDSHPMRAMKGSGHE